LESFPLDYYQLQSDAEVDHKYEEVVAVDDDYGLVENIERFLLDLAKTQ
jgi:hypothetical protein